jgi:hypothetical protein
MGNLLLRYPFILTLITLVLNVGFGFPMSLIILGFHTMTLVHGLVQSFWNVCPNKKGCTHPIYIPSLPPYNKTMDNRKNWQEWFSVVLLLIGASLLALNISSTKWAFPILGVSRLWLTILMYKKKDHPMFIMNLFYFIIDIVGIIRWF